MKKVQHTAFYISRNDDKDWLIKQITEKTEQDFPISLGALKGEVYSNATLQHLIMEEVRHDHFEITAENKNPLNLSSSGEQRKALLTYLIAKKPDYIVVDNVFESLDQNTRESMLLRLTQLSVSTLIIQVFNRKDELLPFVETIYTFRGRELISIQDKSSFLSQTNLPGYDSFTGTIPPPLARYEPEPGPLVTMNNIFVQFNGMPVLQNVSWQINPGEFWQLIGPNGSGKTTLLSLITGNSPKGYGQDLVIFGKRKGSGETVWDIKQKIGYFTPSMTLQFERQDSVEQMIISGFFDSVGLYIKPSERQTQLARDWLRVIKMYEFRSQPFRTFQEGHQRMILIARAMVKHPPLLILDEPTSGLDDEMATLFTALIHKIAAETTTAILYVSHKAEPGLVPEKVFELVPTNQGAEGKITR